MNVYFQAKGLWTDKKVAKKVEEVKQKAHWDFVLEEMTWLSDVSYSFKLQQQSLNIFWYL
jgi:hypothetical protein